MERETVIGMSLDRSKLDEFQISILNLAIRIAQEASKDELLGLAAGLLDQSHGLGVDRDEK